MIALVILLLTAACDTGLRVVGYGTAGSGGGSGVTGGTGGGAAALVGVWRSVSQLPLSSGEIRVLDVRWTFGSGGDCDRTRIQTLVSGNAGTESTDTIACTYVFAGSSVTVTFAGSSVPSQLSVAFSGGDLLLAGTRFTRIG
ncbi:MAG: hypothetical protein ACREMN_01490 [Gemmatimonadales bacterium]